MGWIYKKQRLLRYFQLHNTRVRAFLRIFRHLILKIKRERKLIQIQSITLKIDIQKQKF